MKKAGCNAEQLTILRIAFVLITICLQVLMPNAALGSFCQK